MRSAVFFILLCVFEISLGLEDDLEDEPDETCPSTSQYIYHGGKDGSVHLDCGYQDIEINASQYAVCDVPTESLHILELPICKQMKSIVVLTSNDSAEYDRGQHSGYQVRVPDIALQRSEIEKYFRKQTWILASDDGVILVCGYLQNKFFLKEGAVSRCFGSFLDPNQVLIDQDEILLGKGGQIFFYYNFVNNNDLSVQENLLVDSIMDSRPVFYKKTWYLSAIEGFYLNCAGITKGDVFDHSFLRYEWQFIKKSDYARCNGLNILIDYPRHGDTVWMIKPGLYVQGREGIVLDYFRNNTFPGQPVYVSAKDDMMLKCGSFTYHVRKNEVVSCNGMQSVRTGVKYNIIEGAEGVTYYYPLEMYLDVAENFYSNYTEKYISLDLLNLGNHFGVQEELVLRLVRSKVPEKASKFLIPTMFKLSPEQENKLKYFAKQHIAWEAYP